MGRRRIQGSGAGVVAIGWQALLAVVFTLGCAFTATAQAAESADSVDTDETAATADITDFEDGVHYESLLVPVPTDNPGQIDVVEVFSYMCVHCYNFDATVAEWSSRTPADVAFRREPAIFNRSWAVLAQAFYTAEALGISDKTHDALFEAIHNEGQNMTDPELLEKMFTRLGGVDTKAFAATFNSFSVRSKVEQANTRGRQYRIAAVPSMIVNGKYRVEGRMAGSNTGMLRIVDFLVAKERAAMTTDASAPVPADAAL